MLALIPAAEANHSLLDLLSTGPPGGDGPADATFVAASKDGTHVFFVTKESLVPRGHRPRSWRFSRARA